MRSFTAKQAYGNFIAISATLAVIGVFCASSSAAQAPASAQKPSGAVFQAPGASIYYETLGGGNGTPLIVINGGPGFDHTYLLGSNAWKALGQKRKIIFYDQRGTGRSGPYKAEQSYTVNDQISDLEALRAQLGIERADFLGHSWGGFLAMAYGAKYPQHVAHLILVDSVPAKWSEINSIYGQVFPDVTAQLAELNERAQKGDAAAGAQGLRDFLGMLFYSPEKRDEFLARFSADSVSNEVSRAVHEDVEKIDLEPKIAEFAFPTLVANGRFDTDITPENALKLSKQIPHSKFLIFERSGHLPFIEEPEEFARAVDNFLAAAK